MVEANGTTDDEKNEEGGVHLRSRVTALDVNVSEHRADFR
jgi:hypothetical protein